MTTFLSKITFTDFTDQTFSFLSPLKSFLFAIGLIIWIFCPVLGVIPLLLFLQIKVSQTVVRQTLHKSKKKNIKNLLNIDFFCILIILFTLVVTASTLQISSDLKAYIDMYSALGKVPFFEYMKSINSGTEPVTFIIPNLIKPIFGENEKVFLITQSLTLNLAYIISAIVFLPRYYPIVILFNITSQNYFLQLFLMRQFYSFLFLVPLIYGIHSRSRLKSFCSEILLSLLSLFTHSSSIIFSIPIIIFNYFKDFILAFTPLKYILSHKKISMILDGKIFFLLLTSIFSLVLITLIPFLTARLSLFSSFAPVLVDRTNRYVVSNSEDLVSLNFYGIFLIDFILIFLSLLLINFERASNSCKNWSLILIISVLSFFASYQSPVLERLVMFFSALPGFFYTINLQPRESGFRSKLLTLIIFLAIFIKSSSFYYRIVNSSMNSTSNIWGGDPLNANIIDYLLWLT